jgi:hypothetical protein
MAAFPANFINSATLMPEPASLGLLGYSAAVGGSAVWPPQTRITQRLRRENEMDADHRTWGCTMKILRHALYAGTALWLSAGAANAALVVTPTSDATTLANTIVGSGITIVGTPVYVGATNQSGTFTGGTDAGVGLGIADGVIMTSGNALLAPGPNDSDGATAQLFTPGDAQLDLITAPNPTTDAASLTFVFQFGDGTTGGDLFFQYAFASEEYNEFVNSSFNDVFALYVDGTNIAIAPNGSPVSINNVNCGNPYSPPTGPNCAFFNNNDPSDGGPFFNIQYDGFTDVFTAVALDLGAGQHTMKFAIADTSDFALDSAIFIKGSSFSDEPPVPVSEPGTLALFGVGLAGLAARLLRRRKAKA